MNILPRDKQVAVVAALTEGCSIRAVERMLDVHRDTIMRLGIAAGEGCHGLNDRLMCNLNVGRIELDEVWSYIGKKQKRLRPSDPRDELGDQYVYVALDASGFSKKLRNHKAAVALYAAHYNLCRVHETLRVTPAMAIGVADHIWSVGELVEAALTVEPAPLPPPRPAGRPNLRVIQGGLS